MNKIKKREPFSIWPATQLSIPGVPSIEQQTPLLWGTKIIRNVTDPVLIPFYPTKPNGTAVIICPGGAFRYLMIEKEGTAVAHWLNAYGVTAFVLKYRLAPTPYDDSAFHSMVESLNGDFETIEPYIKHAIEDGQRAVSILKQQSRELGIDQERIGIIGFSAGGAISVYSALSQDPLKSPHFLAAIYGAPPLGSGRIPANAPPLFLAQANDDNIVGNLGIELFLAWSTSKSSVEFHAYAKGGHGFGIAQQGLPCDNWTEDFISWLKHEGYLPKK